MSDAHTLISENLVLKIRKLLALSAHVATPEHEAAAAAGMVQKLMAEYNLSMHQVEDAGTETVGGKREQKYHDRAAMYQYQRDLMACIAKNNFCRHWINEVTVPHEKKADRTRKSKRHFLLGRDVNIQSVEMVYDYLITTMDRLLPYRGMELRGKDALLWLAGCTERLVDRLNEQRRQAELESQAKAREAAVRTQHPGAATPANALVLSDIYSSEDELNRDFLNGWEPGTTARKRLAYAAEAARLRAKRAELVAAGMDSDDAYYVASYGEVPSWVLEDRLKAASETPAQARRRAEKEANQQRAWERKYYSRQEKEEARRSTTAFRKGSAAGDAIGLDPQVGNTEQGSLA